MPSEEGFTPGAIIDTYLPSEEGFTPRPRHHAASLLGRLYEVKKKKK